MMVKSIQDWPQAYHHFEILLEKLIALKTA